MEEKIIKLIKSVRPYVDGSNIKYSNSSIDLNELISLCNFRLEMYDTAKLEEKNNLEYVDFLKKKIKGYSYLKDLGILAIKMAEVDNNIYYFDEKINHIYIIVDNIHKELEFIV